MKNADMPAMPGRVITNGESFVETLRPGAQAVSAGGGKAQADWIEPIGQKLKRAHRLVFSGHDSEQIDGDILLSEARDTVAALVEALDPQTLEAIADEIGSAEHSARAESLRGIARRQRVALKAAGVVL